MKITVYTIKDCAFSKQEKEYLNTNKLQYVEKDLETNKDFLTEMLAVSNNFAGTPVTRVEKDDGTIAVLKGFTKEEFDTTFGLASTTTNPDVQTPNLGVSTDATVLPTPPIATVSPTPIPTPTETPAETPVTDKPITGSTVPDPLKSVMDDLQSKSEPVVPPTTAVNQPVTSPPADAPAIPDFPAK